MDENPYAPPQVGVVDTAAAAVLPGWSVMRLYLLAGLSLAAALGSLLLLLLALLEVEKANPPPAGSPADWLSLVLVLLGSYLLLMLKAFAEARFAAKGLTWPVWLVLLSGLLLEGLDLVLGERLFHALDGPTLGYFSLLVGYGLATLWLGVRLLQVENVYPGFRLMAWLEIAGGGLLASVVLVLLAILPLLAADLALMGVFVSGAREQRRARQPGKAPG